MEAIQDRVRTSRRLTLLAALAALLLPATAGAADSIYWAGEDATIHVANSANGSNASTFNVGGAPCGVAIDSAANKIYWTDFGSSAIRVADLANVSGTAQTLATEPSPCGVAIDPAAGKIYWADTGYPAAADGTIRAADLTNITGTAQTLISGEVFPTGVAIDPAAGKIYWANQAPFGGSGAIRGANLADVSGTAATLVADSRPIGVAVDPAASTAGRIYWASCNDGAIRGAGLNGLTPATPDATDLVSGQNACPAGVALDPSANKLYWANFLGDGGVWNSSLTGAGPAQLVSQVGSGSSLWNFPALLKTPAFERPGISGGPKINNALTCQVQFAPDLLGAFLYRAPQTVHYQWKNGNVPVGGDSATFTPIAAGDYTCTVTAANQAGTTVQTSAVKKVKK